MAERVTGEWPLPPDVREEDITFFRLYGPWQSFTIPELKSLFDPIGISWWIAGGHAAEAFHQSPRHHEDIDVSIFRSHVPELRKAVEGRYHVWSVGHGTLRPVNDEFPEPADDADQVWLRAHALAPWRADVLLNPDRDGNWLSRRDPSFSAPLEQVTWLRDGVRYLKPEIVLAFKARRVRPKDEHDFGAIVPRLDAAAIAWLRDSIIRCERPDHPWLERL